MQKNWYIVYTRPGYEKKVSSICNKRRIENFLPTNKKESKSIRKTRVHQEPLFTSYVFVNLVESDIVKLLMIDGVLNLMYWKGKPAIIHENEIELIKEFVSNHHHIKLEKAQINLNDVARLVNEPIYSIEGNLLSVKNTIVKMNLPSIGFTMVAEIDSNSALGNRVAFGNKELFLQSQ